MKIYDYPLSINKINLPKELENIDALTLYLKKLIIMDKGTYESNPNMGVGIRNYRYDDPSNLLLLKNEIEDQIMKFLPYFSTIDVNVEYNNKTAYFKIILDKNIFSFKTSTSTYTLEDI